jgi:hypothetical protein
MGQVGKADRRTASSDSAVALVTPVNRIAVLTAIAVFGTRPALAQGAAAVHLHGVVRDKGSLAPLEHAMVTLQPVGRQTFTDDAGRFTLVAVPPGTYRLRAAHLGHAPAELVVVASIDSQAVTISVDLQLLSVRLGEVRVIANPPCLAPGPPDPRTNREFAALFEQMALNAQQFRLLSDSFPYVYRLQRTQRSVPGSGIVEAASVDTFSVRAGENRWRYRPGGVVTGGIFGSQRTMHLPTLEDFASDEFLHAHCFQYAGSRESAEGPLVGIDFRAADRIRTPDVHGSIWLDAGSFQIRSAELALSRMPGGARGLKELRVTTVFREIQRAIPAFSEIHAVRTFTPSGSMGDPRSATEDQQLLDFAWLRGAPGGGGTRKP